MCGIDLFNEEEVTMCQPLAGVLEILSTFSLPEHAEMPHGPPGPDC